MVRRKSRYSRKLRNTRRLLKKRTSKNNRLIKQKKRTRKYKNVVVPKNHNKKTRKMNKYFKKINRIKKGGDLISNEEIKFNQNEKQPIIEEQTPFTSIRNEETISKDNINETEMQAPKKENYEKNDFDRESIKKRTKTGIEHLKEGFKKIFGL